MDKKKNLGSFLSTLTGVFIILIVIPLKMVFKKGFYYFMDKKTDIIREMLLRTVARKPDLFCYYVSLLEARKLLEYAEIDVVPQNNKLQPARIISQG